MKGASLKPESWYSPISSIPSESLGGGCAAAWACPGPAPFPSPSRERVPSSSPGGAGGGSVSTFGSTSVFCSDGSVGMIVSLDGKAGAAR